MNQYICYKNNNVEQFELPVSTKRSNQLLFTQTLPTTKPPPTKKPTTKPPTTKPPTTIAPTTMVPTTMRPTTIRPTTIRPTTMVPTTMSPTTRTMAPTTMAPTTMRPTMAPTTMAPTTRTMAPTTMRPTMTLTTMAPTTMRPTMTLTTMPPTTMAPTTMAPTTMAPTIMAPTTMVPTTIPLTQTPSKKSDQLLYTQAPGTTRPTTPMARTKAPIKTSFEYTDNGKMLYGATFVPFSNLGQHSRVNTLANMTEAVEIAYTVTNRFRIYNLTLLDNLLTVIDQLGYTDIELLVGLSLGVKPEENRNEKNNLYMEQLIRILLRKDRPNGMASNITWISIGNEMFQEAVRYYSPETGMNAYNMIMPHVNRLIYYRNEIHKRTGKHIKIGLNEVFGFYNYQFDAFQSGYKQLMSKLDFAAIHIHPLYSYGSDINNCYSNVGNLIEPVCNKQEECCKLNTEKTIRVFTNWAQDMWTRTVYGDGMDFPGIKKQFPHLICFVGEIGLPTSGSYVPGENAYDPNLPQFNIEMSTGYRNNITNWFKENKIIYFWQSIFDNYIKPVEFEKHWGLFKHTRTEVGKTFSYVYERKLPNSQLSFTSRPGVILKGR